MTVSCIALRRVNFRLDACVLLERLRVFHAITGYMKYLYLTASPPRILV